MKRLFISLLDLASVSALSMIPVLFLREYFFDHNLSIFIMSFITFNKDIYKGQSIIKIYFYLQVVDFKTKKTASPLQCFIRNITFIIYPIEAIILLFSPTRRIGDLIARTEVIEK